MTDNKVYFLNRNAESLLTNIRAYTGCVNIDWGDKLNKLAGNGTLDDVFASAFGMSDNSGIRLRLENYKTQKAETVIIRWSEDTALFIGDYYSPLELENWNGHSQYTIDDLKLLEQSWASATDSKKYARLSYETWKKIFRNEDRPIESVKAVLYFQPQGDSISFKLYRKKNNKLLYLNKFSYVSKDSFGHYLYKRYFQTEWIMELTNKTPWYADYDYCEKPKYKEENKTMTITNSNSLSKSLNLDIGTCEKDNVKMSPYGLAVKNSQGVWVSYDAKTGSIMDVEILNFDCGKFLFKIPVALEQIKAGDVIIHNRVPMFVKAVKDGAVEAVDIVSGSVQVVLPVKNMFNFNFVTKIISLVDFSNAGASKDNPFGNLVPFMLLAEGNSNGNDLLPLLLMNGGMNGFDMSNPLALYALCGSGSKGSDLLPIMLLSQSLNGAPANKPAN
jgi:hypothetical protein